MSLTCYNCIVKVLLVSVLSVCYIQPATSSTRDVKFSKQTAWCDLDQSCFHSVTTVNSKLECLVLCSGNTSCNFALYLPLNGSCYINYWCAIDHTATCLDPGISYYLYQREGVGVEEPQTTPVTCLNGGEFDSITGSCDCSNTQGYGGDLCQHPLTSCRDLANTGVGQGHYPITTDLFGDGSSIVQTHCVISGYAASLTMMRSSGRANKDLSWTDYVNGFRISDEDYWIGLENVHRFTSDGSSHRARFGVSFNSTVTGDILESVGNFVVGPASSGYAYTCNSYSNRASTVSISGQTQYFTNLIYGQSGKRFSTVDNDQDTNGLKHCAQLAEAGWWFGTCQTFSINPLGWSYTARPGASTDSHVRLPGVDMSHASLAQSFQRVYWTIDV